MINQIQKENFKDLYNKKILLINTQKFDGAVNSAEIASAINEVAQKVSIIDIAGLQQVQSKISFIISFLENSLNKKIFSKINANVNYRNYFFKYYLTWKRKVKFLTNQELLIIQTAVSNSDPKSYINVLENNLKKIFIKRDVKKKLFFIKEIIKKTPSDIVLIYNGRFLIPSIAYIAARQLGLEVKFTEGGARKDTFEMFEISPHSHLNRATLAKNYWFNTKLENKQEIAIQYAIRRNEKNDIDFISLYQERFLAENIDHMSNRYKDYVIFYLSSEWEFASHDIDSNNETPLTQVAAIEILQSICSALKLHFVVKIHPNPGHPEYEFTENSYWSNILNKLDIEFIDAYSSINTFKLTKLAKVNVVYNSSVGADCVFNSLPIVALAEGDWTLVCGLSIPRTKSEISSQIRNPVRPDVSKILPYYFYWAKGGSEYKNFKIVNDEEIYYKNKLISSAAYISFKKSIKFMHRFKNIRK
jgi:hypothetical protein